MAFWLFLLGIITIIPFVVWAIKITLPQQEANRADNKVPPFSETLKELFSRDPNPNLWAISMSLVISIVCFLYSAVLAFLPIEKTMDFVLAGILIIIIIPSLIAFGYSVSYMTTDMYSGALMRIGNYFETQNISYLAWLPTVVIFMSSAIGTMLASLTFSYLTYYLITRQPIEYIQLAGKRRRR